MRIWPQVRDVRAEQDRLAAAGARVVRKPAREPWGLVEMWIEELQVVPMGGRADQPLRHGNWGWRMRSKRVCADT
ncbi:MAG: VOC family protein [Trebonia sp.]